MILVTGSLGFDHIMDFPGTFEENILPEKLKTLSVSFLVDTLEKNFGGTAGNIAYNLGLLGLRPTILSSAGGDFAPFKKHLQKSGVNTRSITVIKEDSTASFFVITDRNNCQIAGFYPGAMRNDAKLKISSLGRKPEFVLIAPTMPQAMTNFAKECKRLGIPYLYTPAQQTIRASKEQLLQGVEGAELLVVNDYEMELLLKKTGLTKQRLQKITKVVVTTLGEKGSLAETSEGRVQVKAAKSKKWADPTGAGDAYVAGFVFGYLKSLPLKICGQIGGMAAVYALEKYGTQKHKFTKASFTRRYRQNFNDRLNL